MTNLEIERTFLARYLPPEITGVIPVRLVDTYIPEAAKHPKLRLRQQGDSYVIIKKTALNEQDASLHQEDDFVLTSAEYEALRACSQRSLSKDRYFVQIANFAAQVDVFRDALTGLVMVDFEFNNQVDADAFTAPDCCLIEVTQDDRIAGGRLAGTSYSDIAATLTDYGYQAIAV